MALIIVIVIIAGIMIVPKVVSDYRKVMNTVSKVDKKMDGIDEIVDKINAIDPALLYKAYEMIENLTKNINGLNMTVLELFLKLPRLMNEFNISSLSEIPDELSDKELRDFITKLFRDSNYIRDF